MLCRNWIMKMIEKNNVAQKRNFVSVVVPFYNEENGVEAFYQCITPILDGVSDIQFEVICIDDGSSDKTLTKLIGLVGRDMRFRVIELSRNFGKEAALTAGIDAASGGAVIPIDADLQDPPELIPTLIDEWRKGAEVVLARRVDRSADTFMKRKSAELFYRIHNVMSNVKIPENVGDFRLMDRVAIDALKQLPERQRFMKGLFAWIGFDTVIVDYARNPRASGHTKFSAWKLWNFALEGVSSFSAAPLKIWTYIGVIGTVASFSYASFIIVQTLVLGVDVPGYASLLVVVLLLGSLQLVSIGILGEYIGRIYLETKQRPVYLVRRQYGEHDES